MKLLDLTLPSVAENLALDEALLDVAVDDATPNEVLRLWELPQHTVIMGRGTRRAAEVDDSACNTLGIEVQRRVSGGASIVAGPGCLMYSLVLQVAARRELSAIDAVHALVMGRMSQALAATCRGIEVAGICDLVLRNNGELRKFSGNSLRVRKRAILYHGTLLYDFDLSLIAKCLKVPPRQPAYRESRDHSLFVANLPRPAAALREALANAWQADRPLDTWPRELVEKLVAERYARHDWNA